MPDDRSIIVLTAPSGAGKTTIAHRVLEERPNLSFSVSATTRDPRPEETDGRDYHFLSVNEFEERINDGDLLEYEQVYDGLYYGTLKSEIAEKSGGGGVLLDIDVKGAINVKKAFGDDALVLFIAPPSVDELERRLSGRGTETDAGVETRLNRARMELGMKDEFDAVVVNDQLDQAVEETLSHVDRFVQS